MKNLPELTDHITDPPKRASKDPASSAAENGVQNLPCTSVEGNVVAFSLMFTKGAAAVGRLREFSPLSSPSWTSLSFSLKIFLTKISKKEKDLF